MKHALSLALLFCCATLFAQSNPVPFLHQPLVPASAQPGGPGFLLTVNGANFVSGSVVTWNGSFRPTQYISGSQLQATISATDIASAGTALIRVSNPAPAGGISALALFPVANSAHTVSFKETHPSVAGELGNLVVEDFNGDGKLDIATIHYSTNTVQVLLGKGDGTFQDPVSYPVPVGPYDIVAGDFNGDGKVDLATCSPSKNAISILLGNGNGTFQSARNSGFVQPVSIAAADLNRDGTLDLVAANGVDIGLLFGNGDGTFQAPIHYETSTDTSGPIAVADFNGDDQLDVATVGGDLPAQAAVFLANGKGTLGSPQIYNLGRNAANLVAADIDGDNVPDLMTSDPGDLTIDFLIGTGDGTFTGRGLQNVASAGLLAVGDFNNDAHMDVASLTGNALGLLFDNGSGTFSKAYITRLPGNLYHPVGMKVGDFNNDGRLDLAGTFSSTQNGSVLGIFLQNSK